MINEPEAYAQKFLDAGSDLLSIHAEVLSGSRFDDLYSLVSSRGKEIGLAIKPNTDLPAWAVARLEKLSCVVVMTVNPGFSGQSMDLSVMPKLAKISGMLEAAGSGADVEVDGGVDLGNVHEVVKRGGNVLVAGAGVYGASDPVKTIGLLRERARAARGE